MSVFGPLFRLQWLGMLCPCLLKDEDSNARQALLFVNAAGRRILWIRTSSSGGSSGFSLGSFFRSSPKNESSSGSGPARLMLRDNSNGHPEILVDPTAQSLAAETDNESEATDGSPSSATTPQASAAGFKLNIKLGRVDKVTLDGDDIVLTARPVKSPSNNAASTAKELLRLRVLSSNDNLPVKQEERNMFLHHMAVLVEWERQRRATNPELCDDDDDDDEDQPNFLQARAQKAAHFAKRELEMQQTKREREKRKAKFVAESGGLKYTALAMAGRTDS